MNLKLSAILFAALCGSAPLTVASELVWTPATNHVRGQALSNLTTQFTYTNATISEIVVNAVEPSCHCTTPKIPKLPWTIPAHAAGNMEVVVELAGKWGTVQKTIEVRSARETNTLRLEIEIPEPDPREKNRLMMFADRQAVFKGDCADCHLKPAIGLKGEALFAKACAICHEAEHRASMVPDLASKPHGDATYWTQWVRIGKPGSFMPAFDKPHGGPLSDEQITSLITWLQQRFPPTPAAKAALPLD